MKIISIINQKGGVAKTTTALEIGGGLSSKGYKVLFIDLDAQGNLTDTLGGNTHGAGSLELLKEAINVGEAISQIGNSSLISSSLGLSNLDLVLTSIGKEYRLKTALEGLGEAFDYVVIDTPPVLGIATVNALTASTGCIIPTEADYYSLKGVGQLYSTIEAVKKYCNPSLKIMGLLITRFNQRAVISRDMADLLEQTSSQMGTKVYSTKIRECSALKEAHAMHKSIFEHSPKCNASKDYENLIKEILKDG